MRVSIVTPWLNCPELVGQYRAAVAGADEVIVIDNGGAPDELAAFATVQRNPENAQFSLANNQGYQRSTGDIVLFLNNDIMAPAGWLDRVRADVTDGALYGAAVEQRVIVGQPMMYLEGWCVAATRATWDALNGPWDADAFPLYYSDVDLSWRAARAGVALRYRRWPVTHLSNYTASRTPGAYDGSRDAWLRFVARVEGAK